MNLSPKAGIPWGGGSGAFAGNTAADYVAAWRHVVSIFRADGAANAEFVWAPNVDDGGIPFTQYFPGDEWVDDVGLDGYNWGSAFESTGHKWLSLGDTFASSYATLTQLSSKPVMITETASAEIGGDKASWIRRGFLNEIPQLFPRVTAVIWFDVQKESDWRVDSSPGLAGSLPRSRRLLALRWPGSLQSPSSKKPAPVVEEVNVTKKIHGKAEAAPASRRRAPRGAARSGTALSAVGRGPDPDRAARSPRRHVTLRRRATPAATRSTSRPGSPARR